MRDAGLISIIESLGWKVEDLGNLKDEHHPRDRTSKKGYINFNNDLTVGKFSE